MLQKVIGIISYLPDEITHRKNRIDTLQKTIDTYNELFPNVDILIIAQNWQDVHISGNNLFIKHYDKLGIVGARKKLQEVFLASKYDYLIMSDDDIKVAGNKGDIFLKEIDDNPNSVVMLNCNTTFLTLFAISKYIYSQIKLPDENPESGGIFEDVYIIMASRYLLKDKVVRSQCNLEHRTYASGSISTWWDDKKYNIRKMIDNTYDVLRRDYPGIEVNDEIVYGDKRYS